MKTIPRAVALALAALLALAAVAQNPAPGDSPAELVYPMLGCAGAGGTVPGPAVPFGMVKPSPDCGDNASNSGWRENGNVNGFSQTHVSGTGGGAKYGNILVMPVLGELSLKDFSSPRENETAETGYYRVDLKRYGIGVEITAAERAAFYRFSYPSGEGKKLVFDAGHFLFNNIAGEGQHLTGSGVEILSPREVAGWTELTGGWNLQKHPFRVYFYAALDTPSSKSGVFRGDEPVEGVKKLDVRGPVRTGAWLEFALSEARTVNLKLGISFTDVAHAKRHAAALKGRNFDDVRAAAVKAWNDALGVVKVESADRKLKRLFYSTLYHVMLMPVDRTLDNPLWESKEPYYDDFYAIWDTFRTSGPMLSLIAPERQGSIVRALVDIFRHEGFLPDGRSGNANGRVQGGSDADIYIADAFVKGVPGVDWAAAYEAVRADAEREPGDGYREGRGGVTEWKMFGYLPMEAFALSGCKNVEYAYNDFCVAELARKFGAKGEAKKYLARSAQWRNVWDADCEDAGFKGFIRPRHRDGSWKQPFSTMEGCSWGGDSFYEGNSWTYSFFVPHDMATLVERCGGKEKFVARLDELFDGKGNGGRARCDLANEPFFLAPYLYIHAGRHDLAAARIRKVLSRFNLGWGGIPGNDDSGALGCWFSFSSMGIFPVAGQDWYYIGTPFFERTQIALGRAKSFTIRAENLSDANCYVVKATLNGRELDRAWLRHSEILAGGELVLSMASTPDNRWVKIDPPSPLDVK